MAKSRKSTPKKAGSRKAAGGRASGRAAQPKTGSSRGTTRTSTRSATGGTTGARGTRSRTAASSNGTTGARGTRSRSAATSKAGSSAGATRPARSPSTRAVRAAAGRSAAKKPTEAKRRRVPNPSFMRPVQPDEALAAVVGDKPMPRTELTRKLWAYIRKKGLQDERQRRMINADEALRTVFGGRKQVSMFEMTRLVSDHIR